MEQSDNQPNKLTDELIQQLSDEAERGYDLATLKPRERHSHGENVSHAHRRGAEPHTHIGKRHDDGVHIVWTTTWEDGTTQEEVMAL